MIIRIIILLNLLTLTSCSYDKESTFLIRLDSFSSVNREYEDTYYKQVSDIYYNSEYKLVELSLNNIYMTLKLIDFDSYVSLKINDTYKDKYIEVDFNHAYGENLESAMKKTGIFRKNDSDEGLLIIPSVSGSSPTYTAILFNNSGIYHSYSFELQQHNCNNFDTLLIENNLIKNLYITQRNKECEVKIITENPMVSNIYSPDSYEDEDMYYAYKYYKNNENYKKSRYYKEIENGISSIPSFYGKKHFSFGSNFLTGTIIITKNNQVTIETCGANAPEDCSLVYQGEYKREMEDPFTGNYSVSGNRVVFKSIHNIFEISNLK
ncbi:hypothetical protein [Psychrobacter sp. FME5]|uniref:hypothetical protein n=2 Tax=unclassified Psychrobacter TaxID=196806 RepID=UPI0017883170|nr:hypothetical protein [Psychrobacter sp. FME5]MBE0446300.1 hypothetical protein [Psychrobacter sp. FME5]